MLNDTNVYGCFLDAIKVFDRVNHSVPFEKLLSRNLPPALVSLLLLWYTNQKLCVTWGSCSPEKLSISNGGMYYNSIITPISLRILPEECNG